MTIISITIIVTIIIAITIISVVIIITIIITIFPIIVLQFITFAVIISIIFNTSTYGMIRRKDED